MKLDSILLGITAVLLMSFVRAWDCILNNFNLRQVIRLLNFGLAISPPSAAVSFF